jgi:hypothetical protein
MPPTLREAEPCYSGNNVALSDAVKRLSAETKAIHTKLEIEHLHTRRIILEVLQSIEPLHLRKTDEQRLHQELKTLGRQQDSMRIEKRILESLYFPQMEERYHRIPKAHAQTFEWIFSEPSENAEEIRHLGTWLSNGSGIYWISGRVVIS